MPDVDAPRTLGGGHCRAAALSGRIVYALAFTSQLLAIPRPGASPLAKWKVEIFRRGRGFLTFEDKAGCGVDAKVIAANVRAISRIMQSKIEVNKCECAERCTYAENYDALCGVLNILERGKKNHCV